MLRVPAVDGKGKRDGDNRENDREEEQDEAFCWLIPFCVVQSLALFEF